MASQTQLPEGVTLKQLKENWDTAFAEYAKTFRRIQLLDAADRGKLWETLKAKFPAYQLLPDTNHVNYVKTNILAALYTVAKSASILPASEDDRNSIENLNTVLNHYWGTLGVGTFQMQAGERAALTNLGITQVGWGKDLAGTDGPKLRNVDPTHFMYDPYAMDFESASYCMTWDLLHKEVLKANPDYAEAMEKADKDGQLYGSTSSVPVDMHYDRPYSSTIQNQKGYVHLIIHWVKKDGKVHEIHTLDNRYVLKVIEDLKPSMFPFALLYCNLPAGDLIGTSQASIIFSNSVAYNLMNSIILTSEYKNQRPPVYVDVNSGINMASFIKHHNDADYVFPVRGNPSTAAYYHKYPEIGAVAFQICTQLAHDIQTITGIDPRYTGRDTGSVITTGGIEAMLDQVTLIDAPKIANYETYTRNLTKLILGTLVEFGGNRKYFIKKPDGKYESILIDFDTIDMGVFDYEINISSELPKNKARIAQTANAIMEKQMQYQQMGMEVDLMTPEEWLQLQDLPNREYMMTRMGIQRNADYVQKVAETLFTYDALIRRGTDPREAIDATALAIQQREDPNLIMQPGAAAGQEGVG